MTTQNPFKYFKTSPKTINLAVIYYVRYTPSFCQVEDILHERGIDICHALPAGYWGQQYPERETVRFWVDRFGAKFALPSFVCRGNLRCVKLCADSTAKATNKYNLALENPTLIKEWNYTKNKQLTIYYMPKNNDKVWWKCQII